MDLIGLLPKSTKGQEYIYILVLMDYVTKYPESVPMRKDTSRNIVKKLMVMFSCVGIPKDILTDHGMPFMSK